MPNETIDMRKPQLATLALATILALGTLPLHAADTPKDAPKSEQGDKDKDKNADENTQPTPPERSVVTKHSVRMGNRRSATRPPPDASPSATTRASRP